MTLVTATVKNKTTVTAATNSVTINGADATVQLNGSTIGTVASGATGDFPVTQDGSTVGSWNGSAWIIPPATGGTLTITVKNALGNPITTVVFNQTIYIELDASIAATDYTWLISYDGVNFEEIEQVGDNVLEYTTNKVGDVTIKGVATDGTTIVTTLADTVLTNTNSNLFISKWNTNNTSSGSSDNMSIKLPLVSGVDGTYNFDVDWGDGTPIETITVYNQAEVTHTYAVAGEKTITIDGQIRGFQFNNGRDKLKLLDISNYGTGLDISTNGAFYGCSNFNATATDQLLASTTDFASTYRGCSTYNGLVTLDTSNGTSFAYFLSQASSFNQPLNIDTSNGTSFSLFLFQASSFNQTLENLDVRSGTRFAYFLVSVPNLSTPNYDATLEAWALLPLQSGVSISFNGSKYTLASAAETARAYIISNFGWIITDGGGI